MARSGGSESSSLDLCGADLDIAVAAAGADEVLDRSGRTVLDALGDDERGEHDGV
jgi:hypothetical protein